MLVWVPGGSNFAQWIIKVSKEKIYIYHENVTLFYHAIAKYVPAINISLKHHTPKLLNDHYQGKHTNVYATYKVTLINHVNKSTINC